MAVAMLKVTKRFSDFLKFTYLLPTIELGFPK